MYYYSNLMKMARSYYKLAKFYKSQGNIELSTTFARRGADLCREAITIKGNT